jgi:HEAT repeat protein
MTLIRRTKFSFGLNICSASIFVFAAVLGVAIARVEQISRGEKRDGVKSAAAVKEHVDEVDQVYDQLISAHDEISESAISWLVSNAAQSSDKRRRIVEHLIKAIDIPDDQYSEQSQSRLWFAAAEVFRELKATEAIDVLEEHLDRVSWTEPATNGFRHMPAVRALSKMGEEAVPSLTRALYDSRPRYRSLAVLCLCDIGGPKAVEAVKIAISLESDPELVSDYQTFLKRMRN